jgi:hypothetical protein
MPLPKNILIPKRVTRRAYSNVTVDESGCWISNYSTGSHGYAQIQWQEAGVQYNTTAHRASWTHVNGPIADGYTVDHLCRKRRCVNPDHLRLLSNFDNGRRNDRDWPLGQCANGHPDSELIVLKSGRRACGPCRVDQNERAREQGKLDTTPCWANECHRPSGWAHGGRGGLCQVHADKGPDHEIGPARAGGGRPREARAWRSESNEE